MAFFHKGLGALFWPQTRNETYINHQVELFKPQQTSTVTEYQGRFECLCNCVVGLTPETILNCFISGLSIDILREFTILNPYSIAQAIGLAKLIEDKLRDSKPKQHRYTPTPHPTTTNSSFTKSRPNTLTPPSAPIPIKHLSSSQMQERRALGLCYNCDDKFFPGHKCATSRFLLLLDDPDTVIEPTEYPIPSSEYTTPLHFHISPQAISGTISPKNSQIHRFNPQPTGDSSY